MQNSPALWLEKWPVPNAESHKYSRGHTLVMGGEAHSTGASKLAALAALRSGAGLVSIGCSSKALPMYAGAPFAVMTKPVDSPGDLEMLLDDERITACLIGPGAGVSSRTRDNALHLLSKNKACVIDADAISVFKPNPKTLFAAIASPTVLTPHEGEFARLFTTQGTKTERALQAAKLSGAVVVLKGSDTVIANPDGRFAVNDNAPAWLATAGSGDVLAGIITGLLAQGMLAFEAACCAVWMHGRAASLFGIGLIADDLPGALPQVLKELAAMKS